MYTDKEYEQLEEDERLTIEEVIILLVVALNLTKSELEKELRSFYQKYGTDGVVTYAEARKWISDKDHRRRSTALDVTIAIAFASLLTNLTSKFESLLRSIVKKENSFFNTNISADDLLKIKWGADELNWLDRLTDDAKLWEYNLKVDVKRSLLRRDNVDDVIEQVDKRFISMEKVIEKLILTEATAIGSFVRREIFKELGITKYRYYAKEDERTCEICGSLHGLIFPVSSYTVGVNASPMHPHCRCIEIGITE